MHVDMPTAAAPPLFSLIVGTKGRSAEIAALLASLAGQTCQDFEVIFVDQNADDRVAAAIAPYRERLRIVHEQVSFSGLSRARNVGLRLAGGRVFAFPDDDCTYPPDALEVAASLLSAAPLLGGICGKLLTPSGDPAHLWWAGSRPRNVNPFSVWHLALSATIFVRKELAQAVGDFDETLGVGAATPWGSGEETDYLLRAMELGFSLRYEPTLVIWHPPAPTVYSPPVLARGLLYGGGLGRVLRKNRAPGWFAASMLARAFAGICLGLLLLRPGMARFHLNVLRGRWNGWHSPAERSAR